MTITNSSNTQKALGVGVFYLFGGLLAIVGWPPVIPSVLLGSGMALMVYHFLGGIDASDRINWTLGQKAVVQVGGASVILLSASYGIWAALTQSQKDNLKTSPDTKDVVAFDKNGNQVNLKIFRGNEAIPAKETQTYDFKNMPLSLFVDQAKKSRLLVRVNTNSSNLFLGNISLTGDDQPIVTAITDLMLKDYFNPTLIALRSSFCGGLTCPTSSAGFQIFIKPDKSIKQGSIDICYGEPEIGETFAPASSAKDSSQYIKKLNLSSSYDTPSTFPPLLVTAVRYKSSVPACRLNNSSYVIGIINLNDYQKLVSKKDRSTANASLLFATSAQ